MPPPAIGGFPGSSPSVPPGSTPGGIAAPPFAKPAAAPGAVVPQPSGAPPSAAKPSSPLDGGGPVPANVEKKVTLVIDDSAVSEDEIGRKARGRNYILIAVGIAVGLVFGFGVGSTGSERTQYNLAVVDGKEIYASINEASKVLESAKASLKKAVASTAGGPGKKAAIDYKAIEALVALENPFTSNQFHGRRYKAFPQHVVNDLFDYYNNMNILWSRFSTLGAKTAGETKRKALDESAKAADKLMSGNYGMVLFKSGDAFAGGLVLVYPFQGEQEKDAPPKVMVATREGGRQVERVAYMGQEDVGSSYDKYVFSVDKGRSMGLLGKPAKLFGDLRGELVSTQALIDKTIETQGRLIQELGKVAALEEQKFF